MKKIVALIVVALFVPALAHAQERVTVDVNYVGGGFVSAFDYPLEKTLESGKTYQTNSVSIATRVRITDVVTIGYRQEHVNLRKAKFFSQGRFEQNEPDSDFSGGAVDYREIFGSFALPKTHGHRLLVGVTKANLQRESTMTYTLPSPPSIYDDSRPFPMTPPITVHSTIQSRQIGMVVGGEGSQRLGKVIFDYSGRYYPEMSRKDSWSSREDHGNISEGEEADQSSVGWELRGTATWMVAKHFGLTGGYEFRRLRTESPDSSWPINENQTTASVVVGTRFSF